MKGFLGYWVSFAESNKEYVLTFKILAQVLVGLFFSKLANLVQTRLYNTINQA
jgi:hypothetical protein